MLCFDLHEQRKCRSYSGMDFDTHPDSAWPHSHTSLGNVNNQVKVPMILRMWRYCHDIIVSNNVGPT